MMELLPFIGLLALIGAFAGVVAGLLGVGGGIILVPACFYIFTALEYDGPMVMQVCLATSLATIAVTSGRSVASHNKRGAVDWDILKAWAPGIALGAVIGAVSATGLKTTVLMMIFGGLGVCVGLYLAFGKSEWRLGEEMPKGARLVIASPILGFLSVLMGIGGGMFGVPVMTLFGVAIHRAVATAAGFGMLIAVPSVAGFLMSGWGVEGRPPYTLGLVNIPAFVLIIAMTTITAPWGAALAHATDPKPLKRIFAVFIMIMALNMLRKAMGY